MTDVQDRVRPDPEVPLRRRRITRPVSSAHLLMVVAGILAAVANVALLRGADARTTVAVLARDVVPGTPLDAVELRWQDVPADDAVTALLLTRDRLDEVAGQVVTTALAAGTALRRSDLAPAAAPGGLRAMSLPVDPAHAVGGQLTVGDRVDVIAVTDDEPRYVVAGAAVLAVGTSGGGALDLGAGSFSLTIAVDADTALDLATALAGEGLEVVRSTGAAAP